MTADPTPKAPPPGASSEEGANAGSKRHRAWLAVGLFVVAFVGYNANFRAMASYDSLAASLLPFQLWHGKGLALDDWVDHIPDQIRYSMHVGRNGHWYSVYPVVTPVLVSPLYLPTLLVPTFRPEDPRVGGFVRAGMEKLSASVVASLSVAVVFLVLAELAAPALAAGLALIYAFATPTWTISSQGLWQHGFSQLFLAAALWLLARRRDLSASTLVVLGMLVALMPLNRPHMAPYAAALGWIVLRRSGSRVVLFLLGGIPAALPFLIHNVTAFGSILGGYRYAQFPNGPQDLTPRSFSVEHLSGLLFGWRGLLVFCPFLLVLVLRWRWPRRFTREEVGVLLLAWLAVVVLMSGYEFWYGGYCYGPRYLVDGMPWLVALAAAPCQALRSRLTRGCFAAAVGVAVMIQAIGAFCFPGGNSGALADEPWNPLKSETFMAALAGPRSPHFLGWLAPKTGLYEELPPAATRGRLEWVEPPPRDWESLRVQLLEVRVTNSGDWAWSSIGTKGGEHAVQLSVTIESGGERAPPEHPDSARWLARRLGPGEVTTRTLWSMAPARPGEYLLRVQLGQSRIVGLEPFPLDTLPPLEHRFRVPARDGRDRTR